MKQTGSASAPGSRPAFLCFVILLGLFFGGGYAGEQLALVLAPGSGISRLLGFLELPAAFMGGYFLWAGAAVLVLLRRLGGSTPRGGRPGTRIPPGSKAFLWASIVSCWLVGTISGLLSAQHGFFLVLAIHLAVGIAYGTLCWKLAVHGWVQFPRE